MDYSKITFFSLAKTKMDFLAQRQDVLAGNIARADVPGAKAEDLKQPDFGKVATEEYHRLEMRATSPYHLASPNGLPKKFRVEKQRQTYETTPMKNSIVVEEQMSKVAKNNIKFLELTNLYKKNQDFFKTAIGKNTN